MSGGRSVLFISDLHAPYHHVDAIDFLSAIKVKYKVDTAISVGDEVDGHGMNFHGIDPNLFSSGHELKEARKFVKKLGAIFPNMKIMESNHGSLVYRRALAAGIPHDSIKKYKDILDSPKGWTWHYDLVVNFMTNLGHTCFTEKLQIQWLYPKALL